MRLITPEQAGSPTLATWQQMYDRHQFHDLWNATADQWTQATNPATLSTEELVLAGRLAVRLGGWRLSRSLLLRARNSDPTHPAVRYFTEHLPQPRHMLLDELLAFEAHPQLDGADPELQANWLSTYASKWARLRNHDRAAELIAQAHALHPGSAWLYSIEADIHGMDDDWERSLSSAEHAWQLDPASTWAVGSLATALLNRGELDEAVRRLEWSAAETQSAQMLQTACWYRCAATELLEGEARMESLARARALAARIAPLAPLADREFHTAHARTWLDIAQLAGDHGEMERWAEAAGSQFHRQVLANLKRNPAGKLIRLPYRRTLQKHLECVPASVASALSASGEEISVAELAADVTFGGTAEWAAADWLREKGFHVRFFQATAETATRLLEAGFGFITSWEDDDSGHAVAIVGIDLAAGMVLVHDPTSFRTVEYLLGAFDEDASPLGVSAMVAVRAHRAVDLDSLLPLQSAVAEAAQDHARALAMTGPAAAGAVVSALAERFPQDPGTQYLQALQHLEEGRMGQALADFRALALRFPRARRLRSHLMLACRSLGDTSLLRHTLRTTVEEGAVSGMGSEVEWVRPHARYVCEYADLLRVVDDTRPQAETLLRSVLRRNWSFAPAWHILADLRWDAADVDGALLAYSVASHLAAHNEHYARAYADVLARRHRTQEGLNWLESRAMRLGGSPQGISTWITWIDMLEDTGKPELALAALASALERHPAVTALLVYAVSFLARMGQWEQAEAKLHQLAAGDAPGAFHEAAVSFHRMRGEPAAGLEHAEAWVAAFPRSLSARYALLGLVSTSAGPAAAAARAAAWLQAQPANEDFEEAFCSHASGRLAWRRVRLLRSRVRRNQDDGWAWRELAFHAIGTWEAASEPRQKRLEPWVRTCMAAVERISQGHPATLRMHALWLEDGGHWTEAVAAYLEAMEAEPAHFYSYRRAWECSARLSDERRRAVWKQMEPLYLQADAHLPNALEMMRLLAERFGVREAEAVVSGWKTSRPDDPNVLEAAADLLLNHGHGRSDAARALELLRDAVSRFPYHAGLRFSLASACRATGDAAAADQAFVELVRRRPDDNAALIQLAWIQHGEGDTDEALRTLDRARRQAPQALAPLDNRARILVDAGRYDEARNATEELLRSLPDAVSTYERSIALFGECGLPEQAVAAARAGVQAFPRGAYLWLLLGKTLQTEQSFAAPGEVERCLKRSLSLNRTLFEAVDLLAVSLAEQHREAEAGALLQAIEPQMPDPSPALGRIAWLERRGGNKAAATAALARVLRETPWYAWGWKTLLRWLEEDKNWGEVRELLGTVPAPMLADLDFRQNLLRLRRKAAVPDDQLDPEWAELLRDFPTHIPLHLHRSDVLQEAKRDTEAAELLRSLLPDAPENVYLLARLVAVECREKNFPDAERHGLAVCFAALEESPWPANQVWSRMRNASRGLEFAAAFDRRLREGSRPTPRSFVLYTEEVMDEVSGRGGAAWLRRLSLRQTWLDASHRKGAELIRLLETSSWGDGAYRAELMAVLNKHKLRRLVIACWTRMEAAGLASDTRAWAQAGLALVDSKRRRAARRLLQDWRTRTGVQMWMVTNYLLSLSRLRSEPLAEIIATCRDGLATLPHDHTSTYVVYLEAEALVLSGDRAGLLAAWEQHRHSFNAALADGEYFPATRRYLLHDIPEAVRLLEAEQRFAFQRLSWRLRLRRIWDQDRRRQVWKIVVYLLRALFVLAATRGLFK